MSVVPAHADIELIECAPDVRGGVAGREILLNDRDVLHERHLGVPMPRAVIARRERTG
jgi:hypothetical protein